MLYFRDTGVYFYPHKAMVAAALHAGRLPQWNANEFGGLPLLADPNFNVFHPLSLLTWLLPMPWSFGLFVAACAVAAAYGMRQLALELGISRGGALIAGLAFAWCGPFVSLVAAGQLVAPAFVPWLCAAAVRLAREPSRRTIALTAVAAALVLLSGTPEMGACGFLLAFIFAWPGGTRARVFFVLACALGAGLAAVQLLPTAAFVRESSRGGHGFSFADATAGSLDPRRLPGLLVPFFSGAPDAGGWLLENDEMIWVEEIYFGAVPLLLALFGLRQSRRWRGAWIACLGLLVLALGRHTPVYPFLWNALAPLRSIRFPEKLIVPMGVPLALSAGAGWERLRTLRPSARWLSLGAALAASAALVSYVLLNQVSLPDWRLLSLRATALQTAPRELCILLLALLTVSALSRGLLSLRAAVLCGAVLLAVDLGMPAARFDLTVPADELIGASPLEALLANDAKAPPWEYRVDVRASGLTAQDAAQNGEPGWPLTRSVLRLRHLALFDAGAAARGVQLARGYSGFPSGRMRAVFVGGGKRAGDLLGLRYGVEFGKPAPSIYAPLGFHLLGSIESGYVRLWRNDAAQPRLTLWPKVLQGEGASACGAPALPAPAFAGLPEALRAARCPVAPFGSARIDTSLPERVEATVDAPEAAIARIADTSAEGWSASIDGQPAASLMSDGGLRAVLVPKGSHALVWTYRAPGLLAGAIISLLSLALLILLVRRSALPAVS